MINKEIATKCGVTEQTLLESIKDVTKIDPQTEKERLEKRLKGNYFAANDAKGVIVHELAHKAHWDAVKRSQQQSPKRYTSIEKAKEAFDEPIRKYIKTQIVYNPGHLSKLSEDALIGYGNGNGKQAINEVIAEMMVVPTYDKELSDLIERSFNNGYDGDYGRTNPSSKRSF
ncbi:MAG: hypothetical protein Q4A67_05260 [Aerococcus sp.]|nr:hypothetical protein [Aerococcus sp.]